MSRHSHTRGDGVFVEVLLRRIRSRNYAFGLFGIFVFFLIPIDAERKAFAQGQGDSLEQSFRAMVQNLADPELSFRYARVAVESGATQEAVAALERILLANPSLDNIRFELGLLYHSLGNSALARSYIEPTLSSSSIPPSIKARADQIAAEARSAASPHRFLTTVTGGLRYDSNVNAAPGGGNVLVADQLVPLTRGSRSAADGSFFSSVATRYTYDLGFQDFSRFEANFAGSVQKYFKRHDYDTGVLALDVGPWIGLGPFSPSTEIRPYVTGTYLTLESRKYLTQAGGGLGIRHLLSRDLEFSASFQAVNQTFYDSPKRRFASLQTGDEYRLTGGVRYAFTPGQLIGLELGYSKRNSRVDWEDMTMLAAGVVYSIQYIDPLGLNGKPWISQFSAVVRDYRYDGLDLDISLFTKRADKRAEIGFSQSIGLTDTLNLMLYADYVLNKSKIVNYEYNGFSFSAALRAVF